jgi:hypothetical protein
MPDPQVAHLASPVRRVGLVTMRGGVHFWVARLDTELDLVELVLRDDLRNLDRDQLRFWPFGALFVSH